MGVTEEVTYHCRTQMKIKKLNYVWNVGNFWHILDNIGQLHADEVTEYFRLYMNINNGQDELEIYAVGDDEKSINIFCSVFLMTATGEKLLASTSYILNRQIFRGPLFGIKISDLKKEKDTYILKDKLKMRFECSVFLNSFNQSIYHVHIPGELINTEVKELTSENFDKLKFVINGKSLTTSKVLLCSHSKFFEDMFSKESTSKVELNDITYDTFRNLIFFIGTGQLDKQIKTNVTMLCDLLVAANKYDMKNLKLVCEQRIINNVSVQNISYILDIAHSYNAKVLKKFVKDFIKLYYDDIVDSIQFLTLTRKFPELLIEIQNIRMSEGYITY